jgi:protein TonB
MRFFISCLFLFISFCLKSQTVTPSKTDRIDERRTSDGESYPVQEVLPTKDDIYSLVEEQAQYKYGNEALLKFISKNIIYPQSAVEIDIQGKVYVQFVVNTDSTLSDITVVRGINGGEMLNKEAIRVIKLTSKDWVSAKNNSKPVKSKMVLPIMFKLQ